jgi:hypothetical protein
MGNYDPILIKPLKFRGVFGITWVLYKRGFFSMLIFTFLFATAVMLVTGALGLWNLNVFDRLGSLDLNFGFRGLSSAVPAPSGPPAFPGDFRSIFGAMLSGFAFTMIADVISLANLLVLQPIYQGSVYTEMSHRIYGGASSLGKLLKRSGFMLKRFFTTYLCYWLAIMGFSFAVSIVFMILFLFVSVAAAMSFIASAVSVGFIITIILFSVIFIAAMLIGPVMLSFVFPAAVNENIKNFKAIGRSFRLVGKRFKRVIGANFLVIAIVFIILFALLTAAVYYCTNGFVGPFDTANFKIMFYVIFGVEALISLLLLPYGAALNTVLYFDARVRTEGEGWLNYAKAEGTKTYVPENETVYDEGAIDESELPAPTNDVSDDPINGEGE